MFQNEIVRNFSHRCITKPDILPDNTTRVENRADERKEDEDDRSKEG
jgi:hypothetical protein